MISTVNCSAFAAPVSPTSVLQCLDLSSGHVSGATMHWLSEATPVGSHCAGVSVAPYEYGVFVSVPGDPVDILCLDCPLDLKQVLEFARGCRCDIVRLDSDAVRLAALPYFDW